MPICDLFLVKKQIWFVYLPESSTQTRRQGQMQARVTTWASTSNSTCWQIIHGRFYSQIHCPPWKLSWVTSLWGKGNLPLICIYHWLSIGYHPTVASRGMNLQMNLMSEQNSQKIQSPFINRVQWTILPECQTWKDDYHYLSMVHSTLVINVGQKVYPTACSFCGGD